MSDPKPGICDECGRHIEPGEAFTKLSNSSPVYGRIGAPSDEITGHTKPRITWFHEACRETK